MKKYIRYIVDLMIVIVVIGFMYLSTGNYKADDRALSCLSEYEMNNIDSDVGFIFYPGGKVEPDAYSYLYELNEYGIEVFIAEFPFNLAFFNKNAADEFINNNEDIDTWYIGGHSLGGVMAYEYAKESDDIDGVILMASYPMDDDSDGDLNVLSIYGSYDGLVTEEEREEYVDRLPSGSVVEIISGANHAQFGNYGDQKGDNRAKLTPRMQQYVVNELIVNFINK